MGDQLSQGFDGKGEGYTACWICFCRASTTCANRSRLQSLMGKASTPKPAATIWRDQKNWSAMCGMMAWGMPQRRALWVVPEPPWWMAALAAHFVALAKLGDHCLGRPIRRPREEPFVKGIFDRSFMGEEAGEPAVAQRPPLFLNVGSAIAQNALPNESPVRELVREPGPPSATRFAKRNVRVGRSRVDEARHRAQDAGLAARLDGPEDGLKAGPAAADLTDGLAVEKRTAERRPAFLESGQFRNWIPNLYHQFEAARWNQANHPPQFILVPILAACSDPSSFQPCCLPVVSPILQKAPRHRQRPCKIWFRPSRWPSILWGRWRMRRGIFGWVRSAVGR